MAHQATQAHEAAAEGVPGYHLLAIAAWRLAEGRMLQLAADLGAQGSILQVGDAMLDQIIAHPLNQTDEMGAAAG